jgi:hypothetical protein
MTRRLKPGIMHKLQRSAPAGFRLKRGGRADGTLACNAADAG